MRRRHIDDFCRRREWKEIIIISYFLSITNQLEWEIGEAARLQADDSRVGLSSVDWKIFEFFSRFRHTRNNHTTTRVIFRSAPNIHYNKSRFYFHFYRRCSEPHARWLRRWVKVVRNRWKIIISWKLFWCSSASLFLVFFWLGTELYRVEWNVFFLCCYNFFPLCRVRCWVIWWRSLDFERIERSIQSQLESGWHETSVRHTGALKPDTRQMRNNYIQRSTHELIYTWLMLFRSIILALLDTLKLVVFDNSLSSKSSTHFAWTTQIPFANDAEANESEINPCRESKQWI